MNNNEFNYTPRLIDEIFEKYLKVFGAVSVIGPKWCGKTWTSLKHANSVVFLDEENEKEKALTDLDLVLNGERPSLIDEWHLVPSIWDRVRRKCDETNERGNYILTCSTNLSQNKQKEVFHSGAGRIGKLKMYTMSLYESGDSAGECSLTDMLNNTQNNVRVEVRNLEDVAKFMIRGGWPGNINTSDDSLDIIPKNYIESILDKDIHDDKVRNRSKMLMLLKSLARNESSIVSNQTLIKDIENYETEEELLESRNTLTDYLDLLNRLYLLENQEAFSINYRSSSRIGKSPKRHFTDPSLACALLDLTKEKLLDDMNTFGLLFESLVERDLRIYIEYLGGHLYHFRDNTTGEEVDAILEFPGGEYATVEIKLSGSKEKLEEAKKSLMTYYNNVSKKPKFMCIITSNFDAVMKDKETGIYILPITSLRP